MSGGLQCNTDVHDGDNSAVIIASEYKCSLGSSIWWMSAKWPPTRRTR